MDINDYLIIKNFLEDHDDMVRESILIDMTLHPENYEPGVLDLLAEGNHIEIHPEFDEEDTPFVFSINGVGFWQNFKVPEAFLGLRMSWGKEQEIRDYLQTFEANAVGKALGMLWRGELGAAKQEKFNRKNRSGAKLYTGVELVPRSADDPRGVRFRMASTDKTISDEFVFYVPAEHLVMEHIDVTTSEHWDEIRQSID
ncbi:MAG: hypothetical protein H9W81_18430 [Enterococcus sp.]|nr:hypothetical protein [Enterococcus sp.]